MKYADEKVEIFLHKNRLCDSKKEFRRAQTPNTPLFSTKMASMGDDQEENIEMWKIKKVLLSRSFLFYAYFFSFVKSRLFLCAPAG